MNVTPAKFLFGIIGSPLGHTASPLLHSWAFAQMNIPAAYYTWPMQADYLENFVQAMRLLPIHGVSVTIPFKQAIIPYLDGLDNLATKIGAVNTLYWEKDKLKGTNTDILGFIHPLRELKPACALVFGAGGAARGVLAGLRLVSQQMHIYITNRNFEKAQSLAAEFNAQALPWPACGAIKEGLKPDLVVNTSPLGMHGSEYQNQSPLGLKDFSDLQANKQISNPETGAPLSPPLAYDLVYRPLHTPFLQFAQQAGWRTQDGLDMLLAQGLEQLKIWITHSNVPNFSGSFLATNPLPSVCQAKCESGILKFIST